MRVPSSPHSNCEWRAGAYQALPLSFGVAAYGWVWGALAVQAGLAPFEAALMSATVFAGTAQFVTLAIWQEPASGWSLMTLMTATLAVNLRFALMSASLQPLFEREGVHRRYFKAFFVSDENWALTSYEMTQGRGSVGFLLGAGGAIYLTWVVGTILGGLMGAGIPEPRRLGLDFAFVASLLALLLSMWRGWARVLPWASAAAGATLGYEVLPGKWYIVLGGVCGSAVAAWSSNAGRVDNEKS